MDFRRKEASALFSSPSSPSHSPSHSTSTSTPASRKNSPRINDQHSIVLSQAYVIAHDANKDIHNHSVDKNKNNKQLSNTSNENENMGNKGKVLRKSPVAAVDPVLLRAVSTSSFDSDNDIIKEEEEEGGGEEGDGGNEGRDKEKDGNENINYFHGIKVQGPTLLGSARSAQLHALYPSPKGKGKEKSKEKVKEKERERMKGKEKGQGQGQGQGVMVLPCDGVQGTNIIYPDSDIEGKVSQFFLSFFFFLTIFLHFMNIYYLFLFLLLINLYFLSFIIYDSHYFFYFYFYCQLFI